MLLFLNFVLYKITTLHITKKQFNIINSCLPSSSLKPGWAVVSLSKTNELQQSCLVSLRLGQIRGFPLKSRIICANWHFLMQIGGFMRLSNSPTVLKMDPGRSYMGNITLLGLLVGLLCKYAYGNKFAESDSDCAKACNTKPLLRVSSGKKKSEKCKITLKILAWLDHRCPSSEHLKLWAFKEGCS
jgi:hypothetical protein